jgi:peptide deformylase
MHYITMTFNEENLIKELVPKTDPILRDEMEKFDFDNPPEDPIRIAHILAQNVIHYDGLGLAAPQLGMPYRAFVIKAKPMLVCFNPSIVDVSDDMIYMEEGCLTYPNLIIKIKRPQVIRCRYTEPNGNIVTKQFQDLTARIFQHELDHLDGILFMDRSNDIHLEQAKKRRIKLNRMTTNDRIRK